ncbi:MAG: hypothetical protein ACFFCY_06600 [Promethearchaeota archaeon]
MNYKKISVSILLLLMIIPINIVMAFTYVDNIKNGNYIFFLTDLEVDNNIEVNITHPSTGSGNFTLFLFNIRPVKSYVNIDNTLDETIFNHSVAHSLDDNPYINYTAPLEKIYYIEIILVSGGPDTFFLTSTITYSNGTLIDKELTRYYLPIIPSFPLEVVIPTIIFIIGFIIILFKKKIKKT